MAKTSNDSIEVLKRNVRVRLAHLGADLSALAEAADMTPATVYGWLKGDGIRLASIDNLGVILGCPTHALLDPEFNPSDYPALEGT